MQRSGAAEGYQQKVRRIEAPLHGHDADRLGDVSDRNGEDGGGRFLDRDALRFGDDPLDRLDRAAAIDGQGAAQEIFAVETAENDVRVRDRRLGTARAVAGRPW